MKLIKSGLVLLGVIVLLSGCATTDKNKKIAKKITYKDYFDSLKPDLSQFSASEKIEAKKIATTHAKNFYQGLKNRNHAIFSKSKKLRKQDFNVWCNAVNKRYGILESQKYVGVKSEPLIMRYVWKWVFKKKILNESFEKDILFSVRMIKYKKKNKCSLLVVGFE